MNKSLWIIGAITVALITAGTIYAMQSRGPDLDAVVLPGQDPASQDLPRILLPQGTAITMRLEKGLATTTTKVGDPFEAVVASPVLADGEIAIPEGAAVTGHVLQVQPPGTASGQGLIQLTYYQLSFGGHSYDLNLNSPLYERNEIETGTMLEVGLDRSMTVRRTP